MGYEWYRALGRGWSETCGKNLKVVNIFTARAENGAKN
jgi:hypothetical protein